MNSHPVSPLGNTTFSSPAWALPLPGVPALVPEDPVQGAQGSWVSLLILTLEKGLLVVPVPGPVSLRSEGHWEMHGFGSRSSPAGPGVGRVGGLSPKTGASGPVIQGHSLETGAGSSEHGKPSVPKLEGNPHPRAVSEGD